MVQEILGVMDGDEVNSIDDTIEASQVADIVVSTYNAMMSNRNWPHAKKLTSLTAFGDTSMPTHMTVPDGVKELIGVKYNKFKVGQTKRVYQSVRYLDNDSFLRRMDGLNSDADNVDIIEDTSGVELLIRNDQAPTYYTSFNDVEVVFDSYDNEVETTLQESKVRAQAFIMLSLDKLDDAVPDLPEEAFASLIEEAKSKCQLQIHQFEDPKSEQEATRQRNWLSRKAFTVAGGVKYRNYGRRGHKFNTEPTFEQDRE